VSVADITGVTDLLAFQSTIHRALQHGIAIVPGDLETVDYIINPRARRVTISRRLGLVELAVALGAAVDELLPDVSAEMVADGTTGAVVDSVVVPLRPRLRAAE
jgi:hypothetical protein